jgi:3-ketoacyl-CoA synthase
VLDGVQSAMRLADADLAPSRQVLFDYGNVSSSSTWYGLAACESLRGVAAGDRVVQIGVGSGVKVRPPALGGGGLPARLTCGWCRKLQD